MICLICNKEFRVYPSQIKRGVKYCSSICYYKSQLGKPTWNKDKKTGEINCECNVCGKKFHTKQSSINRGRGKNCSLICRDISKSRKMLGVKDKKYGSPAETNPNWQGGISKLPYHFDFDEELKEKIRKRDNYECGLCHITEEEHIIVVGRKLSIHHIDYNKENCDEKNLKSLCSQCNSRVNFNREYWKQYFSEEVMSHVCQD
jgi:hypothetical protein